MTMKIEVFAAALAAFWVCGVADAQMRTPPPSVHLASGQVRTAPRSTTSSGSQMAGASANPQTVSARILTGRRVSPHPGHSGNFLDIGNLSGGFSGVPGLGFDFPDLAAVSTGSGNHFGSHFGHHQHPGPTFFVPIFFGGYPYYYDDSGSEQAEPPVQDAAPQPQNVVNQQPVSSPAPQDNDTSAATLSTYPQSLPEPAATEVADIGDFILVRRDGRILFASAFSVVGEQLRYITPQGIRRTLAMSDLDADASQQMNEARGTTVRFRN